MAYVGGIKRLVEVIPELSSARSLEQVMTIVRSAAREIARADGATFVLKEGPFCHYADEEAISPLWKGQRFPLESCISGWSMINKKAVVIQDIYQDPRIPFEAYRPTFVKSLAMVPIRVDDPIGAIGVYWAQEYLLPEDQLELLQALADSVSVALENINLYSDLKKKIEQLELANEAKDNFLLTVSHELRTPLNAIIGWTDILREDVVTDEEREQGLDVINRNAKTQARIVEDLLDSTRIVVGRMRLEQEEVELIEVLKVAVSSLQTEANKKAIKIHMSTDLQEAPVKGDALRLQQVFTNLLVNAIKFSYDGGEILVKVQKRGPGVQIQIEDHGVGISDSTRQNLFDRFHQADNSTTRRFGGLGLGLSISKHLIESHNGQISIFSDGEGRGTTAQIILPMIDKKVSELAEVLSRHAREGVQSELLLRSVHVLAVDDDEDSLKLMETVLRRSGAKVEKAHSVQEALRLTRLFHFDAVVSDLSMPEEDGFSLIKKVRAGQTALKKSIPAVAVTAFNDQDSRDKALSAGFDQFFGKPLSRSELIHSLERFVADSKIDGDRRPPPLDSAP
ncbi:ATP-binding protein [Bdellovibrio sp. HCB274]|uniref:hybrid sensor histidine kinase/response regulator n=1 Tax=Bdellovibrio sp. HCB274 TaxID=3394361 RepID=UPI0039B47002